MHAYNMSEDVRRLAAISTTTGGDTVSMKQDNRSQEQRIAQNLTDAVAEAIHAQLGPRHSDVRWDLWLMADDTVTWQHSTWPAPEGGLAPIWTELNVEDLLGPYWSEGLDTNEDGEPIVTEEQARDWALGWATNCASDVVRDALEAVDEQARLEAGALETARLVEQGYGVGSRLPDTISRSLPQRSMYLTGPLSLSNLDGDNSERKVATVVGAR